MAVTLIEDIPKPIIVKADALTMGEVEEFEDLTGLSVAVLGDEDRPKGKVMRALTYLSLRREGYELDFDDLTELKLEDIEFEGADDEDPPSGA